MALTLGNNLTGGVSRTVIESNRQASTLGESMTSGLNQNIESVDAFLGNSLRDNQLILGAIAKNTNYSTNMLATAKEYMNILAQSLQEGLTTIGSSGQVSAEKLATLEQSLSDTRTQVSLLIKTADFDNKALLTGGVQDLSVQVGLSTADKLNFSINNLGEGRLFRSGVTRQLINYLAANVNRSRYYAADPTRLTQDMTDTKNLITEGLNAENADQTLTNRQLATALTAIRNDGGTEDLDALSGVTQTFNTAARAALKAAWKNIFENDVVFKIDNNTAAAAEAAAEAVVVGMENELDIADIKTNVNREADTAAANNGVVGAVGNRAELLVQNLLNGGVADNLGNAIDSHSGLAVGTGAALTNAITDANNDITKVNSMARAAHDTAFAAAAANAAVVAGGNAAAQGAAAAAYVLANGGTPDQAALAAGAAAGVARAGTAAQNAAAAELAVAAANIISPVSHAGDVAAKAAAAAAAAHNIAAGRTAAQAAAGALAAAGVAHGNVPTTHQGDAKLEASIAAVVAHAVANGSGAGAAGVAGAAAGVISYGSTPSAISAGTHADNDGVLAAGSAAAGYIIATGGTKAEAVKAALNAAAAARTVNSTAVTDDAVITARAEAAYDAAVALSNDAGSIAESVYLVYNSINLGTYDANKMEPTLDKTTTAVIEKVLDDAPSKEELIERLKDDALTNLQSDEGRAWSQNLFMSALDSIRNNQASVQNQQTNILGAADALRATNNVTEKAADSYLKTDYVLAAQQYSELIRTIVAAITALQAANKIPEAAQQLLSGLTR